MKTKDSIQYHGDKLVTQFTASGALQAVTSLAMEHSLAIAVDGNNLVARRLGDTGTDKPLVIESFASPQQANNALQGIRDVVNRRLKVDRLTNLARAIAKYVVLPFGVVLFGLAMNVAVHAPAAAPQPSGSPFPPGLTVTPPPPPRMDPASLGLAPIVPADKIASALKRGAASGKFAVHLGPTKGEPVFVFEDPNCTHCRDFAPEAVKLAKTHPVYIFPVPIIGGEESARLNAITLCAPEVEREKKWAMAMSGALTTANKDPEPTEACQDAAKANELMYTTIGLRVTPTVFNGKGEMMPLNEEQTAAGVEAWLKSGA